LNWDLIRNYVLKGFYFSIQLTVVATIGGILFGTVLALMRLSGNPLLVYPATFYVNGMRSIPLVMVILWFFLLVPLLIGRPVGAELGHHHLRRVRGGVLQRDHARRHPVHLARPGQRRPGAGHDLRPEHAAGGPAAGLPQHAAGAADADHHPVPGHLAGLCHRRLRPAQGLQSPPARSTAARRGLPAGRRRLLRHLLRPVLAGQAPAAKIAIIR
jgi:His/Glu/Gln/Arg/opine family amino acid ABC transporter permease subunit